MSDLFGRWRHLALAMALAAAGSACLAAPALAYQRGDVTGAMTSLRSAAQSGHAPSQSLLGFILDRADFSDEAAAYYRAAAAQDDPDGHAGLAQLYASGRGVAKDEKQALAHFSKAAELGHAASIDVLVQAYRSGRLGVQADAAQASHWQARAAELRQRTAAAPASAARP